MKFMDGGDSYREELARLAALRAKADRVCAGMRATLAEWRRIREMSEAVRSAAQALKNEAWQASAQTTLAVANRSRGGIPIDPRLARPGTLGAAVGDRLAAHNDNLGAEDDAFARGGTPLA